MSKSLTWQAGKSLSKYKMRHPALGLDGASKFKE
jgi:hypothetical protein